MSDPIVSLDVKLAPNTHKSNFHRRLVHQRETLDMLSAHYSSDLFGVCGAYERKALVTFAIDFDQKMDIRFFIYEYVLPAILALRKIQEFPYFEFTCNYVVLPKDGGKSQYVYNVIACDYTDIQPSNLVGCVGQDCAGTCDNLSCDADK